MFEHQHDNTGEDGATDLVIAGFGKIEQAITKIRDKTMNGGIHAVEQA